VSHLGGVGIIGWLAVHGFFVLSGYLMTLVLNRSYGYQIAGISKFLINRALRLYPLYWCVLVISSTILVFSGTGASSAFYPELNLPNSVGGWISNIFHIYPQWFPGQVDASISPPSWTLTIEWLFYILMALGLSRTWQRSLLWIALAMGYFLFTHLAGMGIKWRYSTLAAGALPFAIGAGLFHLETVIKRNGSFLGSKTFLIWLCGLLVLNGLICLLVHAEELSVPFNVTFYVNIILNAALITNLSLKKRPTGQSLLHRWDKIAGDLSYPIYLLHLPIAFGVSYFIFGRSERVYDSSTLILIALTLIVSSILGLILNRYPDSYVRKLRERIKNPQV